MTMTIGLDMGTVLTKVVVLEKLDTKYRLVKAAAVKNSINNIADDTEKNLTSMAESLKKLFTDFKLQGIPVGISLAEKSVFTQVIELPKMSENELASAIPWEAENLIPQPLDEITLDWEIVHQDQNDSVGKIKVLLVAAPNKLINNYMSILDKAGIQPAFIETEALSQMRYLNNLNFHGNTLIVNFGHKTVDLYIVKDGYLYTTRSSPSAGEAMTRVLSSSLNIENDVAEEYKKTYGLSQNVLEGKIARILMPVVDIVISEIKKMIRFYSDKESEPLKLTLITGGSAVIPGIAEVFAKELAMEVQVANPFMGLEIGSEVDPGAIQAAPIFCTAVGLAMR